MLENLTQKFNQVVSKLKGYGKLTENNIDEALREVRLALLEADVHVRVVKELLAAVKVKALGQDVIGSLKPGEQFLKLVHEELIQILGGASQPLVLKGKAPQVIILAGLQGCGKTTSAGKLANYYKKKGKRPYLVPADVYRPAAIDQLKTLAGRIDVPVYPTEVGDKPVKIVKKALSEADKAACDLVIIDTAGRLQIDDDLMDELKKIYKKLKDPSVLFVADAMTGQEAVKVSKAFHEVLPLDGLVLTKLDGDARGGAALSIQKVTECKLYFTGVGEGLEDFEAFDSERFVSRILDRGDILSLVEKAQDIIDEEEAKNLEKKIRKNQLNLEDFRNQLRQMKKLGSMKSLISMVPGGKAMTGKVDFNQVDQQLKLKEAIIDSMTKKERLRPEILNGSRRLRIAQGSGTKVSDVNRFMKEFAQMRKMMKKFSGKGGKMDMLKGMWG